MLDCIIKILDLIIKTFTVIGIGLLVCSYARVALIDSKIKKEKKVTLPVAQKEARLKPLREERERIISKIPFIH